MKRFLAQSVSAALLLSVALPALALQNPDAVANRVSRRLLTDPSLATQDISVIAVRAATRLRQREQAVEDTSGRSQLQRAQITTRIRTIRGARVQNVEGRPSRRSILDNAESMLVLPPALVQTGAEEVAVHKVTRRTLIELTRQANQLHVNR